MMKYLVTGMFFGIILVKAQVVSWFQIQEMFKFQRFHMYGIIGSAVAVGMISVALIKRFNIKTVQGENVIITPKKFHKGQIFGGLIFGLGWGLTGACPGPIFAQIGSGEYIVLVVLAGAIAGTWTYGYFRDKLPH